MSREPWIQNVVQCCKQGVVRTGVALPSCTMERSTCKLRMSERGTWFLDRYRCLATRSSPVGPLASSRPNREGVCKQDRSHLCYVITEVTFHHLCCILLEADHWGSPHSGGRDFTRASVRWCVSICINQPVYCIHVVQRRL